MNYLTTIPNMNSTPELPIEALIEEAYEDFTQHSQSQREAYRSQQSLEPEWHPIIIYQAMQRKSIGYRYHCCT